MQCYNPVTGGCVCVCVFYYCTHGVYLLHLRSSVAISASSFAITSNYVTFLFSLSQRRYRINAVGDAECRVDTFISNMVYVATADRGCDFNDVPMLTPDTFFPKWQRIWSEVGSCSTLRFFMILNSNRIHSQKADYRYNPFTTHAYTMLGYISQRTFLHQNCWIIIFNLKLENLVMQMMRSGTEGCTRTMWQAI